MGADTSPGHLHPYRYEPGVLGPSMWVAINGTRDTSGMGLAQAVTPVDSLAAQSGTTVLAVNGPDPDDRAQ